MQPAHTAGSAVWQDLQAWQEMVLSKPSLPHGLGPLLLGRPASRVWRRCALHQAHSWRTMQRPWFAFQSVHALVERCWLGALFLEWPVLMPEGFEKPKAARPCPCPRKVSLPNNLTDLPFQKTYQYSGYDALCDVLAIARPHITCNIIHHTGCCPGLHP